MTPYVITKTQYKVSDFLNWQKAGSLILTPKFQRRAVWRNGAKSYLVDSIINGFPIPILFLREQKTDLKTFAHKRQVVDGQQRIRTILSFVSPECLGDSYRAEQDEFFLTKAHNAELAGLSFERLPEGARQAILDYEFSVQVLPSTVDDRQVIQIFARMNATGYKLNPQELRNAAYYGEFKTSMYKLAAEQLLRWEKWGVFTWNNIARMNEVEITSEFAQLMMNGIVGKSQRSLDALYRQNDDDFEGRKKIERRFRAVMDILDDVVGDVLSGTAFRKRAPFYALFASIYGATYGFDVDMRSKTTNPLPATFRQQLLQISGALEAENAPRRVMTSLARRTTHPSSRRTVTTYLMRVLNLV